jgi:hypothetical protein
MEQYVLNKENNSLSLKILYGYNMGKQAKMIVLPHLPDYTYLCIIIQEFHQHQAPESKQFHLNEGLQKWAMMF